MEDEVRREDILYRKRPIYDIKNFKEPLNGYIQLLDTRNSNKDQESRINFVTSCAAISRGKDESKNPEKRYKHLKREASPKEYYDINNKCLENMDTFGTNVFDALYTIVKFSNDDKRYGSLDDTIIDNIDQDLYKEDMKCYQKGSASRPLEFVQVVIPYIRINNDEIMLISNRTNDGSYFGIIMNYEIYNNYIGKYSTMLKTDGFEVPMYVNTDGYILTNLRTLINARIPECLIPYDDIIHSDFDKNIPNCKFIAMRMNIPMFVFNHFITHTQLSKETRSERVVTLVRGNYWLPEDIVERINTYNLEDSAAYSGVKTVIGRLKGKLNMLDKEHVTNPYNTFVMELLNQPAIDMMEALDELGYPKEIYQRSMLEFRYKDTIMAGWVDDNTWMNFLRERGGVESYKNWVQDETKKCTLVIYSIFKDLYGIQ